jgi:multiple sugar transport system ATP-binding protein
VATVELLNVSKTYDGRRPAVRDVTLEAGSGEFVVLVGPSGCGKSTLLRMIAGLESVTSGHIRIGGRPMEGVRPSERDVAMVFQNYALYPHLSVFDNMAFGLRMRRVPPAEIGRRVQAAAGVLGIGDQLERRPRELSGGERQRVALGRAMVREPQVFLFDEPLSNLDAKLRVQMRAEIKRLHHAVRATMIYVTHDQTEAMTLGDRIAVMNTGSVQQVADPFQIYRQPANRFVAEFLGTPPINVFRARIAEGAPALESNGLSIALPEPVYRRLGGARGQWVDVGVRPEHVRMERSGTGESLSAEVEVVEPLGGEVLLHWRTALGALVSRTDDQYVPAPGQRIGLRFDWDTAHFFDAESQRSIAAAS